MQSSIAPSHPSGGVDGYSVYPSCAGSATNGNAKESASHGAFVRSVDGSARMSAAVQIEVFTMPNVVISLSVGTFVSDDAHPVMLPTFDFMDDNDGLWLMPGL